jgi:hypothetical protein
MQNRIGTVIERFGVPLPILGHLVAVLLEVVPLIDTPCNSGTLNELTDVLTDVLHLHPMNLVNLFLVNRHPFGLTHPLSNEKVCPIAIGIKLNFYPRIYFTFYANACFLIDLSCRAILRVFVLIPFPLWEPKFIFDFYHQYLRAIPVKHDGSTYWLIFLQLHDQKLRVDFEAGGAVLFELEQKLVPLLIQIFGGLGL